MISPNRPGLWAIHFRRGRWRAAFTALAALVAIGVPPAAGPAFVAQAQGATYVDPLYGYTLTAPPGWWIEPPPPDSVYGVTLLYNYDPELADSAPAIAVPNPIKIQIGVGPIAPSPTFADWLAARILAEFSGDRTITAASPLAAVSLAGMSGQAVVLQGGVSPAVLEMNFPVGSDAAMSIGLTPADSPDLNAAMAMLNTLRLPDKLAPAAPAAPEAFGKSLAPLDSLVAGSQVGLAATLDQCSPGNYSGNEAPTSPIELWMPFRDGETWQVGGGGAWYGNYFHCNFYNDYYATDWNRPNDQGADVLPAADGAVAAVVAPPCPSTGYGCYVTINHAGGARTLYGHLSGVNVVVGQAVKHWDKIGSVGNSGNSTGAHLHLRFQTSVNGTYYSHCYNNNQTCPNGEAPQWPQSPRPSPMNTQSGPVNLQPGASYTSNNRQTTGGSCPTVAGMVVVYDLVNCGGESAEADGLGLWTLEGYFNDRTEAVAVPAGWSARLYLHNSTASPSVCLSATATDLRAYQFSDGQTAENKATWMEVFNVSGCAAQLPDLVPFPLPSRPDPVIAAATAGTNNNGPLFAGQTIYVDWGLKNTGQANAGAFYVDLYIDSQQYIHYPFPNLDTGQITGFPDWGENWPAPGWHTITVIVDPGGSVTESNENNNVWTGQFYWQPSNPVYLPIVTQ